MYSFFFTFVKLYFLCITIKKMIMELSAQSIADYLGGEIIGNPNIKVSSVARIEQGKQGTLCFLANPKYEHYLYTCNASIVLLNKSFETKQEITPTIIKVENAYESIASLLDYFNSLKNDKKRGNRLFVCRPFSSKIGYGTYVGKHSVIECNVRIGKNCQIYPQVYIGKDVVIGSNTIIYPGVKIYHGCKIGNDCIIHANAVIGADGFGFAPREDGTYKKIPQTGNVVLEDNVEIGANTTVDRATIGSTLVHKGVKIDNLCQIAHNVEVGENTVMAALSGIAGSAKIGKHCMFGGQSGMVGHIYIADNTTLAAKSVIVGNVKKEGAVLMGYPAINHREYLKAYAIFKSNAKK